MNSFFRICIIILLLMLSFILISSYISTLEYGEDEPIYGHMGGQPGPKVDTTDSIIVDITGSENMAANSLWLIVTIGAGGAAILLGWMMHSMTPIGLYIFSEVFWTGYWRMTSIFSYGGYIPLEFIFIITGLMVFLFIAAVIGMLTGSG